MEEGLKIQKTQPLPRVIRSKILNHKNKEFKIYSKTSENVARNGRKERKHE